MVEEDWITFPASFKGGVVMWLLYEEVIEGYAAKTHREKQ